MSKNDVKRSVKSRQLKSGLLFIKFDGTLGALVATGPDASMVSSIVDLGAGNYTVILTEAFEQDLHAVSILGATQSDWKVTAVADDRITILGGGDDAAIHLTIATFDNRFLY